jgi:hypothetical protein
MDLSTAHAPIGHFLEQPEDQQEWQKFRLTEQQIASFKREGISRGSTGSQRSANRFTLL